VIDPHSLFLLIAALVSVIVLILLVAVGKLNPFITLMLVSLGLGVVAGMPATGVVEWAAHSDILQSSSDWARCSAK
jgi:GntP family gluconate:H+ symporter